MGQGPLKDAQAPNLARADGGGALDGLIDDFTVLLGYKSTKIRFF
jgi:hypothetical protein